VDPVFVTLQKTINLHNLTDHVAVVKAVMCVNVSALAVGSMAGYCYAGWMLLGWFDVVTLAAFKLTVWQFCTLAIFKLAGCCYAGWLWLCWLAVVTLAGWLLLSGLDVVILTG
jgi:hypothetical protein